MVKPILMKNIINFCKEKEIEMIIISHNKNIIDTFCENKIAIANPILTAI